MRRSPRRSTGPKPRAAVISASIGAGHDGAARGLAGQLDEAGFDVDRFDFLQLLPGRLGGFIRQAYATELRIAPRTWGWTLHTLERRRLLAAGAAALAAKASGDAIRAVLHPATAVVVSTYPLASQGLGRLRLAGRLDAFVATFLTDMSVHPLWIAPGVDMHLALHALPAAEAVNLAANGVTVCRPAVAAGFSPSASAARALARRRFGLPADGPLALVVAGSWGVGEVAAAAQDIARSGVARPVTACGHNDALRRRIAHAATGTALGWVDDMPALMSAVDVVVQNAGGLTSLEAMAAGVPVVSYRCLPGHGTRNAAALEAAGLANWIRRSDRLAAGLAAVLDGPARHRQLDAATTLAMAPRAVDALFALRTDERRPIPSTPPGQRDGHGHPDEPQPASGAAALPSGAAALPSGAAARRGPVASR
jgi:UDP-N-acetylglucosamine:LPS N-acetylglucosamine transferase